MGGLGLVGIGVIESLVCLKNRQKSPRSTSRRNPLGEKLGFKTTSNPHCASHPVAPRSSGMVAISRVSDGLPTLRLFACKLPMIRGNSARSVRACHGFCPAGGRQNARLWGLRLSPRRNRSCQTANRAVPLRCESGTGNAPEDRFSAWPILRLNLQRYASKGSVLPKQPGAPTPPMAV